MVAQEAIERLARSFRQMRNPSDRCTLNLPLEIILMIATHLDACSLVSFALTCKSLHSLWEPLTCHISYHHTRLVMNRHLYGSNHGLPLRVLNQRTRSSHHPNGVVISVTQHARISNDHLLVLSAISLTHSRGDSVSLRRYIGDFGHALCRHVSIWRDLPDSFPIQLRELAKRTGQSQFLASGPAFGSCTLCPTDYTITIKWQGPKKGFNIEVLVYRGLGGCRTPFSWHWRTNTWLYPREELRSVYSPDCRPGSIREQWDEAADVA
ncbi:hypothetical protein GT037_008184 [Alternaria burnsii]|uniref:F-box domain-containing protein n=1 Tax=Alternaria burnsii TaxID=1187904 RepID=A0A8H7ED11_9PLEO|nr:uncharacterized protein GT037_008184 [Alternaria burnsii]KAF7673569.1 hypothetical protein GT037_008184 [Alternaria burnsii]